MTRPELFSSFRASLICFLVCTAITGYTFAKTNELKPRVPLRPVAVKNIAYSASGKLFAVPNCITAGSVGVFSVSGSGQIASFPSRYSEKDFYRARGVFFYSGSKDTSTQMIFLPLQENLAGYSVAFTNKGDTLAITGTDKIIIYSSSDWQLVRSITLQQVTRAVFSPDNQRIAAVAGGKIFILSAPDFGSSITIEPESGHKFADVAFSSDGTRIAAFEFTTTALDHSSRIHIYMAQNGDEDRTLPYFKDKINTTPGSHFPLVSFLPNDTALAVTLEKSLFGKTMIIKSNDGTVLKELKGICHAVSANGFFFAAGGTVYELSSWNKIGNFSSSATSLVFSPTENVLLVLTPESLQRFRVETGN